MKMIKYTLATLLLFASPAFAQQAAPDPLQDLGLDWQALVTAQKHVTEDFQKLAVELQAARTEIAKLKEVQKPSIVPK